jgi:hypothetical protein
VKAMHALGEIPLAAELMIFMLLSISKNIFIIIDESWCVTEV